MSQNANPGNPPPDPQDPDAAASPPGEPQTDSADGDNEAGDGSASRPQESTQPIDDELSHAAREAQAGPYIPGGMFKPPNTMKILVMVLLLIAGFIVYFIVFIGTGVRRTEMIRQKTLEKKLYDYEKQQQFLAVNKYLPAGKTHPKLTKEEEAELAGLRGKYGRIKIVEEGELKQGEGGILPATAPATATVPSGGGG